ATAAVAVSRDVLRVLRLEGLRPPPPAGEGGGARRYERIIVRREGTGNEPATVEDTWRVLEAGVAPGQPAGDAGQELREVLPELPGDGAAPAAGVPPVAGGPPAPGPPPARDPENVDLRVLRGGRAHVLLVRGEVAQRLPVPTAGVDDALGRFGRRLL